MTLQLESDDCALCRSNATLQVSHIVPRFVVSAIRSESLTGFLRSFDRPNVRLQDAFKVKLLCGTCEQRFSRWESTVATRVFPAIQTGGSEAISYDADFSRFVVSVLWRVLLWRAAEFLRVSPEFSSRVDAIETEWRRFLLAEAKTPGSASCHAAVFTEKLILGMGSHVGLASDRFHRYVQRTLDVNVVSDGKTPFVYAKLGRLLVFGSGATRPTLRSSRIGLRRGTLQPGAYALPAAVFGCLLMNAENAFSIVASLSDRQKAKIDEAIACAERSGDGRRIKE